MIKDLSGFGKTAKSNSHEEFHLHERKLTATQTCKEGKYRFMTFYEVISWHMCGMKGNEGVTDLFVVLNARDSLSQKHHSCGLDTLTSRAFCKQQRNEISFFR